MAAAVSCGLLMVYDVYAEPANRIVSVVNDEVITEGDVAAYLQVVMRRDQAKEGEPPQLDQVRRVVLKRLIEERLIVQEAKRLALEVSADSVRAKLHDIQEELGTPEAYQEMLREAGMSEEQFKRKIHEQLLAQKAIDQAVRSRIVVSPSALAKADLAAPTTTEQAEERRAEHVLVRLKARSDEEALAIATQLHEQLRGGEDVEEVVRRYAETLPDIEASQLDWTRQGELMPELDEALFQLNVGEVSQPIQTTVGVHLIKVVDRRQFSAADIALARELAWQQLYREQFMRRMTEWLEELTRRAYIKILDE